MNFDGVSQEYLESCPLLDQQYRLLFTLGKGRFAKVYLALHLPSCQKLAVKVLRAGIDQEQLFLHEIAMMFRSSHDSVIQLIDAGLCTPLKKPGQITRYVNYLVMPLAERGELYRLIEQTGRFSQDLARVLFGRLVRALLHMHQQNIAHRDIKTENILVWPDLTLKLADFGYATQYKPDQSYWQDDQKVGSLSYNAPEQIMGCAGVNLQAVDVFALGVVLFEMLFSSAPFEMASHSDKHFKLLCRTDKSAFWKVYFQICVPSKCCKDLLQRMLEMDPTERITLHQIADHPWLTSVGEDGPRLADKELGGKMEFMLGVMRLEQEESSSQKEIKRKKGIAERRPTSPPQVSAQLRMRFKELLKGVHKYKEEKDRQL